MTPDDVNKLFAQRAKCALDAYGSTALELLETHTDFTLPQLAALVNRGINIHGLISVIYEEAQKAGRVRQVAKDLLYRYILTEYPNGWGTSTENAPDIGISFWWHDIRRLVPQKRPYAESIIRDLIMTNPPPEGWFPQGPDDPLLEELFDKHWPREES